MISAESTLPREPTVEALILELASAQGLERKQARRRLVRLGEVAVPALVEALESDDPTVRMESVEALLCIASPVAAPALVEHLDDAEFGVRWLAAEALVALKCDGIPPLLLGLTRKSQSLWFRQAAHHVLREHYCEEYRTRLSPVLQALEEQVAEDTAPVAAGAALRSLTSRTRKAPAVAAPPDRKGGEP